MMTSKPETTNDNAPKCEECGEAKATWAVCFDIVKRYPIDHHGDADWSEGEVIQNEECPVLMCAECVSEYETGATLYLVSKQPAGEKVDQSSGSDLHGKT